ncbi:MAG: hypothetical protein ACKOYG_04475 [Ilumatobacteraceae bacterium]
MTRTLHRSRVVAVTTALALGAAVLVACSNDEPSAGVTTASAADSTSTSAAGSPADTTVPPAESTSTTAPAASVPIPTSTIPAVEGLGLSARGLGTALFGAESESVVDYVVSILGQPTTDSGWIDPFAIGLACPGSEIRFVEWDDLRLFFSDDTTAASSVRHFASFAYGPALGSTPSPFGLETDGGIRLGDTVRDLRAAHPGGLLSPGDDVVGPKYQIEDGFVAYVTEAVGAGIVRSFQGGYGCSE